MSAAEAGDVARAHLLEQVIDTAPALLWLEDSAGRVLKANRAFLRAVERSTADVIGRRRAEFIDIVGLPSDDGRAFVAAMQSAERPRTLVVTRAPLDAETGLGSAFVCTAIDAGTAMQAQPATVSDTANTRPLSHRGRARDAFVPIAAHELRSPLNAMRGWAHLLMQTSAPTAALISRAAAAIDRNIESQSRLIDDLLAVWQRIESTAGEQQQPVDIVDALRRAIDEARGRYPLRSSAVCVDDEMRPLTVLTDPDQLHEVLVQVLSAALTSTTRDSAMEVVVRHVGERIRIAVCGSMSKAAEPVRPGIGYALARHLIEASGGRLSAERGAEGPTTYVLDLPLAEQESPGGTPT